MIVHETPGLWWTDSFEDNRYAYASFRRTYHDDPAAFVVDCFHWRNNKSPAEYQLEIVDSLVHSPRLAVRGPHGLGKSALSAWTVLWFSLTRDVDEGWKVATTASSWRQLTKYLWPEIHKWSKMLQWSKIGRIPFRGNAELLTLELKLSTGQAFAVASNDPVFIEGAHADEMLYIFDESKAIPDPTWDSVEGAMSVGNCKWLAVSTPAAPNGRFYDIHSRKPGYHDWKARHVTKDEAVAAGRMDAGWADNRRAQWGATNVRYVNRVLGEFAASEASSVIPLAWVELANERWEDWQELNVPLQCITIGVDVARGGKDTTVFAYRYAFGIGSLEKMPKEDTMMTAGRVIAAMREHPMAHVMIDALGLGAGVFDRVREVFTEMGDAGKTDLERVHSFVASERTDVRDKAGVWGFVDKRAAAHWRLREMLDPSSDHPIALPPDDELTGDLTAPSWKAVSGGKIRVESKKELDEELDRSTNCGDAVVQTVWDEYTEVGMLFG